VSASFWIRGVLAVLAAPVDVIDIKTPPERDL
jgi:hypothetical protein